MKIAAYIPAIVFAFVLAAFLVLTQHQVQVNASTIQGNEYQASQVTSSGTTTLKTLPGSIGSVVMTSTSAAGGAISFYATTSAATSTADLIFSFDATATEGTYQYDVQFGGGLLVDANNAFDGDLVITYR